MFLSGSEIENAISNGRLIVDPVPDKFDENSVDVHLGSINDVRIWNVDKFKKHQSDLGNDPFLRIGKLNYKAMSPLFLTELPSSGEGKVYQTNGGTSVVVRPGGFVLWQTKETIGTPQEDGKYLCLINGKSTRTARTGVLVHVTAPTVNAGWNGNVVLEIANVGPFDVELFPGDAIAQIIVAEVLGEPTANLASATQGQTSASGN